MREPDIQTKRFVFTRLGRSTLRESTDGKSLVTTFEMPPEVQREDIHVGYHRSRLTVTWSTVEMLEYNEEDGIIYRERYEHTHHRTIPLPDGTKVCVFYLQKVFISLTAYYSLMKFKL